MSKAITGAAEVTIIVATYNRPYVLKCAIESVLLQRFANWQLYIVGDACGQETVGLIASFDDPRIHYCNLPKRCGEQSGPNSAGIAAATTKYVALLNQDDIWLPDHLEVALKRLKRADASFYCAGAAITGLTKNRATQKEEAKFILTSQKNRTFETMFFSHPDYLEPASAWVFTKEVFDKVGPWTPAATLYRTPLEDWLLRLWRSGLRHILSDDITVIKCNVLKHRNAANPKIKTSLYSQKETEQCSLIGFLHKGEVDQLKHIIGSNVAELAAVARHPERFKGSDLYERYEALVNRDAARGFFEEGRDSYTDFCNLAGIRKGQSIKSLLRHRTGEKLPNHKNWDDIIQFAQNSFFGKVRP